MNMNIDKVVKEKEGNWKNLLPVFYSYREKRLSAVSKSEREELKKNLRIIKGESITRIDELKGKALKNLKENGIKVIEAKDAKAASEEIRKIIGEEKLLSNPSQTLSMN